MRVVVFSSTEFGLNCIRSAILPAQCAQLVGILTTPRRISISYSSRPLEIVTHADFHDVARTAGCEVVSVEGKLRARNYLSHLDRWKPDLILALGWYYTIPSQVRNCASLGCLGIHASLLPKYRGGAPIPWAIINGETETGVTLFHLTDEIDAGEIVAQSRFGIEPDDTCATVYGKAEEASTRLLSDSLPRLADGTAPRIPQIESQASYFPQRTPDDGLIDWSWPEKRIRDFVRAQTRPYPGAFFYANGKKVVVWDAEVVETRR